MAAVLSTALRAGFAILLPLQESLALPPDGQLDSAFGASGITTVDFSADGFDSAVLFGVTQPGNGKLLLIGAPQQAGETGALLLSRLLADGTPDTDFATNGMTTLSLDSVVRHTIPDANGGTLVILTKAAINGSAGEICRLANSGSVDTNYGVGGCRPISFPGSTVSGLNSAALQSDGGVIAVGFATSSITGFKQAAVARITAAGSLDSGFAANGYFVDSCAGTEINSTSDCELTAVAIAPAGAIYAAGEITANAIDSDFIALALTSGGTLDDTFDADGRAAIYFDLSPAVEMHDRALAIAWLPGDKIAIAGYAAYAAGPPLVTKAAIAFLDSQGAVSGSGAAFYLGTAAAYSSQVAAMSVQVDGRLVLAGATRVQMASNLQFAVARITAAPDDQFDSTFGDGTGNGALIDFSLGGAADANVTTVVFDRNRAVIAGTRTLSNGDSQFAIARLTSELIFANGFD